MQEYSGTKSFDRSLKWLPHATILFHQVKVQFFDDDGTTADQCKAITTLRNICKIAERWDSSDQMAQSIFEVFLLDLGFWEEAVAAGYLIQGGENPQEWLCVVPDWQPPMWEPGQGAQLC